MISFYTEQCTWNTADLSNVRDLSNRTIISDQWRRGRGQRGNCPRRGQLGAQPKILGCRNNFFLLRKFSFKNATFGLTNAHLGEIYGQN